MKQTLTFLLVVLAGLVLSVASPAAEQVGRYVPLFVTGKAVVTPAYEYLSDRPGRYPCVWVVWKDDEATGKKDRDALMKQVPSGSRICAAAAVFDTVLSGLNDNQVYEGLLQILNPNRPAGEETGIPHLVWTGGITVPRVSYTIFKRDGVMETMVVRPHITTSHHGLRH